jgi:hypothetical protein
MQTKITPPALFNPFTYQTKKDWEIIRLIKKGDNQLLTAIYNYYFKTIQLTLNNYLGEEKTQQVKTSALQKITKSRKRCFNIKTLRRLIFQTIFQSCPLKAKFAEQVDQELNQLGLIYDFIEQYQTIKLCLLTESITKVATHLKLAPEAFEQSIYDQLEPLLLQIAQKSKPANILFLDRFLYRITEGD